MTARRALGCRPPHTMVSAGLVMLGFGPDGAGQADSISKLQVA